ncbi:MAG: PD40 domain-containing protein [bacterium]|nr:MAG: PD40 domain-containing protein [bacterium]
MRSAIRIVTGISMAFLFFLAEEAAAASVDARLLRYPSIMGDRVAFVYGGDIYTVPVTGGQARRVTSFPEGFEIFPKISPDGEWIAFSGEYAGTRQVYVVPYGGGVPKRVTYYPDVGKMPPRGGFDYMVLDWTPDGTRILVRCNRTPFGRRVGRYFLVDPFKEGLGEPLQLREGGPATLSPDGKRVAYNIKSREFRTWKRYRAGRAQDVFIYDLERNEVERVTTFEGTDNFPMWIGNAIYFTSDRERTLNLFRYDIGTKRIDKVTDFAEYDVLWPSRGGSRIVFENGGYLFCHDTRTAETKKIPVTLSSDKQFVRPLYKTVKDNIESFSISPSGVRAAFSARGDIFTVPAEHGIVRNITRTAGIREMATEWSPDGKYISYLSEESGEYEVWIRPKDGEGNARQLTTGTDAWILHPVWSPDAKRIAYSDKMNRLWVLAVESGRKVEADRSEIYAIRNYSFSPDGNWLCYTKHDPSRISSIWVYSIESKKTMRLTGEITDDAEPVFSMDGKYLYFVSDRDFDYRNRRFEARIYIGTLSKKTESPLKPLNDEEKPEEDEEEGNADEKGKSGKKDTKVVIASIDADGFADRVVALPEKQGRYYGLPAVDGGLVYLNGDRKLMRFDLEKRKSEEIMADVDNYQVAAKGEKFIYRSGKNYGIAKLSAGQKKDEGKLDLDKMEMRIDPASEWRQIYRDAWRIMRDWFYDPGMHGVDWEKMRDRYEPLVQHLAHRSDLDYIIGELIGELNAGHTYVFSGDMPEVERVPVGLLGCELEAGDAYYRIAKIYRGENWRDDARSPLTEPGLNIEEGSYLISIDGHEVTTAENLYRYLENKAGIQVTITVNSRPSVKGAREVVVTPIPSELSLLYMDWVEHNRRIVDELSNGRIGYIHVPNTHFAGFREFFKYFQPLMNKEALIIDDRYNGGGHSPYRMVQIMGNRIFNYWAVRHGAMYVSPFPNHEGPKAMLINGLSSSGGDAFPYYFKKADLGPLFGERTWGGLIGYGYSPSFVDGGGMAVPGFAFVDTEGKWAVEAEGVAPDIYVFDDPSLIQAGREPMIERAVEYLLEELDARKRKRIERPAGPDRS